MARILYFDEDAHAYSDDLGRTYTSTTTVIGFHEKKFEVKANARRLARAGTGIYANKSEKQIKNMWKNTTEAACGKGSMIHDELEGGTKESSMFNEAVKTFTNYNPEDKNRLYTIDDIIVHDNLAPVDPILFYKKVGYKYPIIQQTIEWYLSQGCHLFAELGIYDEEYLISGMIDLLAIHLTEKWFVIIDWKTNKDDITFESYYYKRDQFGQTTNEKVKPKRFLKYPIDDLPVCKGSIYGLQLSVYAYMVEQRGFKYGGSIIFHIRDAYVKNKYGQNYRDENNNYVVDVGRPRTVQYIDMPYYRDHVVRLFEYHKENRLDDNFQFKLDM